MKKTTRHTSLLLVAFIATSGGHFAGAQTASKAQPNIVLIFCDDLGYADVGFNADLFGVTTDAVTPHIDKLAAAGTIFKQAYVPHPFCGPSRMGLLTGRMPHCFGGQKNLPDVAKNLEDYNSKGIPTNETLISTVLKSAGYATACIGKWHVGSSKPFHPNTRGFDEFYGFVGGGHQYFPSVTDKVEPKINDYQYFLERNGNEIRSPDGAYLTDTLSEEAIGFVSASAAKQKPFFLYLAYNAPHFPMQCMPAEFEKYRGRFKEGWDVLRQKRLDHQIEMGIVPASTTLAPRPKGVPAWDSLTAQKQDEMDAIMATYAGMIDRVDQNIGKLTRHLKSTGELNNTVVFFLSDNGAEAETGPLGQFKFSDLGQYGKGGNKYGKAWATLSNTPLREYKHFTHQGGVQSPLVVHWPAGINEKLNNKILSQNGYLPDLVETCLDLGNAKRPTQKNDKPLPYGDGVSFAKLFRGDLTEIHNEPICIEHEGKKLVRSGKWKLVSYPDQAWELYDLADDFSESNNLVRQHPEIAGRLKDAYLQWAKRIGAVDWETASKWSVYRKNKKKNGKK